jgi:hypothetical protein
LIFKNRRSAAVANVEFLAPPYITAGFTAWAAFSNAGLQHF